MLYVTGPRETNRQFLIIHYEGTMYLQYYFTLPLIEAISVCRKCDNAWQRKICAPHKSISYNHIILSYLILVELEVVYISFNYSLDISK